MRLLNLSPLKPKKKGLNGAPGFCYENSDGTCAIRR